MWLCKFSSNAYGLCLFEWLFVPHTLPALVHSKVHLILILRSYIQHTADCHGDGISFVTDDESQWQWQWPDHHWDLKISMMEFHLFMPSRAAGLLHNNHSACCLALASLLVVWGGLSPLESDWRVILKGLTPGPGSRWVGCMWCICIPSWMINLVCLFITIKRKDKELYQQSGGSQSHV